MGNTTAITAHAAPTGHYIWSFPGSPVRVRLELEVVERMQEWFRPDSGAPEKWGLLLGETDGHTTRICDCKALEKADPGSVKQAIAASKTALGGHSVVGYCRTQAEESLRLNQHDLALAEAFFRDPQQVFLAVQRSASGFANATFFFWDGGRINGDFPFLEFPFDASSLAAAEQHKMETAQLKMLEERVADDAAPPAPARTRRPPGFGRAALKGAGWLLLAAAITAAVVVGIQWFPLARRQPPAVSASIAPVLPAPPSMGLQAERQNNDLKLTWNRGAAVIASATSGLLLIQDGGLNREIPLPQAQVRNGSILYTPVSDQVEMQLSVSGPASNATESVIVILPKAGPPQVRPLSPQQVAARLAADSSEASSGEAQRFRWLKPFTPPVTPDPKPASLAAIDAPPPAAAPLNAPNAAKMLFPGGQVSGPLPPPIQPPPDKSPATTAALAVYRPPVAVSRVAPKFPVMLKSVMLGPVAVEVLVTIDQTGKVVRASAVPQKGVHPMLVTTAVTAAHQWKFQPAKRGDQPVSSEILLRFNFTPGQ